MSNLVHEHDERDRVRVTMDYGRLRQIVNYIDASILLLQKERKLLVETADHIARGGKDATDHWGSGS